MNKKILIGLSVIGVVATIVIGATTAYFSDTETSTGNTFTAGTLNLKVGAEDPTIWNFTVPDVKPGDNGSEETLVANTGSTGGYLHITFENLLDDENGHTEPEQETANKSEANCEAEGGVWNTGTEICNLLGDSSGELAENLDLLIYINEDADVNFTLGIDTLVYQGKARGILQGDEFNYFLVNGGSKDFRVEWDLPTAVGNVAQSDKAGFDIIFELTQTRKDIVGNWHFNENAGTIAFDSSGYGNDGTINGAGFVDGQYNPALSFDGVDDYVKIPDSDVFNMNDYTIEMWVYNKAGDDLWPTLINRHSQSGSAGFWWSYTTGADESQINFQYTDGSGYHAVSWVNTLSKNSWTQIAFVFDESSEEVDLFINGVSQGVKSTPGALPVTSGDIYFGEYQGSSSNRYSLLGNLDEIKIYNRVLSGAEILQNYQAGL